MGKWLAATGLAAGLAVATSCSYGTGAYTCDTDEQCPGGRCEPGVQLCSRADTTCDSGRRFGDLAGGQAGQCVGGTGQPPDGPETPVDAAPACYGAGLVKVCLDAAPTAALTTPATLDTDSSPLCQHVQSGGDFCVLAGTTVTVSQTLRATGRRPLVLIATEAITATAKIDVGSHRTANPAVGAGGDASGCAAGTPPGNNGGGAGGSFTGLGGSGGTPGAGGPAASVNPVPALRGGCPGQDGGGGATAKGLRGHGGGAVYLIAGTRIDITGGIDAAGSGGLGGISAQAGGGGGGSGGMIGLEAPTVTVSGLVLANGGGGGEGSSNSTAGKAGDDATTTASAPGGTGNTRNGGDGGVGSYTTLAGPGFSGNAGDPGQGGGGGGGGAAGIILAPGNALLGNAQLSPPVTTPENNR